jgi:hypothetical protein
MKAFAVGDRVRLTRDVQYTVPGALPAHYAARETGVAIDVDGAWIKVSMDWRGRISWFTYNDLELIEPCPTRRVPPMIGKHVVNIFTVAQLHHGFGSTVSFNRAAKLVIRTGKPHYFRDYDAALIKVVP